jgi:predicted HicB family RNase H-like nuclease
MDTTIAQAPFEARCQQVLQVARDFYHRNPDWVTFFREILGVDGAARRSFVEDEFVNFEQTDEYALIQKMVSSLRARKNPAAANEPTRVITVRLPESLHEALKAEANDHNTSMNKLCISKLLQVLQEAENNARANPAGMQKRDAVVGMGGNGPLMQNAAMPNSQPPQQASVRPASPNPMTSAPAHQSPLATYNPEAATQNQTVSNPQRKPSNSNYTPTQFKPRFNNQGY